MQNQEPLARLVLLGGHTLRSECRLMLGELVIYPRFVQKFYHSHFRASQKVLVDIRCIIQCPFTHLVRINQDKNDAIFWDRVLAFKNAVDISKNACNVILLS